MEAIAPGGEIDSDLLLAAAEFLTRSAEFGLATGLGTIADSSPVWCGRTTRVSPDDYDRYAWAPRSGASRPRTMGRPPLS